MHQYTLKKQILADIYRYHTPISQLEESYAGQVSAHQFHEICLILADAGFITVEDLVGNAQLTPKGMRLIQSRDEAHWEQIAAQHGYTLTEEEKAEIATAQFTKNAEGETTYQHKRRKYVIGVIALHIIIITIGFIVKSNRYSEPTFKSLNESLDPATLHWVDSIKASIDTLHQDPTHP